MIAPQRRARLYPVWLPDGTERGQPRVRRRRRAAPMVGATVMALLLTLPAVGYVAMRTYRPVAGYKILRLQQDITRLRAQNARLSLQVAALKSPQRIERFATTELGMAPPRQHQLAAITVGPTIARTEPPPRPRSPWRVLAAWFGRSEAEARERTR